MSEQIKCPKCGSEQIHADKRGYSVGKAVTGVILTGEIGLVAGAIGSNKIKLTCLKCDYKFNPGEGLSSTPINYIHTENKYKNYEAEIVICNKCGGRTISSDQYCCECGKKLDLTDRYEHVSHIPEVSTCKHCNQFTMRAGDFCSNCGEIKNEYKGQGCAGIILLMIIFISMFFISCKSKDEEPVFSFLCKCEVKSEYSDINIPCDFYFFPADTYTNVEPYTGDNVLLSVTAIATKTDGTKVNNIGYALYDTKEYGTARLINSKNGWSDIYEGTFYVACFPFKNFTTDKPYKAKIFTKNRSGICIINPIFSPETFYNYTGYSDWDK